MYDIRKSKLEQIHLSFLNKRGIEMFIKRDDLIHPYVSGNKWRKLKYNVEATLNSQYTGILTFGGAYSNHLLATAVACHHAGLLSVGIVRGEELQGASNEMLQRCTRYGMNLHFVSRNDYNFRNEKSFQEELLVTYPNMRLVPEGGANYHGVLGCMEILPSCEMAFDHVFVAQGTTTTSCGLLLSIPAETQLHVVPVLKGFDSRSEMKSLLWNAAFDASLVDELLGNLVSHEEHHFGGYGKYSTELLDFMENFYLETAIPLDPIYTGKAMKALYDWVVQEDVSECKLLFLHTGGVEGGKTIAEKEKRVFATFSQGDE